MGKEALNAECFGGKVVHVMGVRETTLKSCTILIALILSKEVNIGLYQSNVRVKSFNNSRDERLLDNILAKNGDP